MAEVPRPFAGLLRGLRTEAGLTQEELAHAAGLSARAISYLERGEVATPHKETVRLLAGALRLTGPASALFEAAARGRGGAGPDAPTAALRTLPRDIASFTGREHELSELAGAAAGAGAVVTIQAIGGMAGVGKTAFAVHAAHQLADRFPGGQIFLPLHGHTPGHEPASPASALASLLGYLGLPAAEIPASLEARTALWRDRAATQRLLLILDDAITSEQVRPLLPSSGGSLVIITSRRHLSALDDTTAISLDLLPPTEAAVLFARLAGRARLNPDDPAVAELIRLCGFLPLAIGMVARQLRHHPAWTPAGRAAQLAAAADRLEVMATENLSVAAAFDLSYAGLTGEQQRLFRRLGLHPGTDIDGCAAAALDGTSLAAARRGLEDLYDQYLLTEPTPGRYRLHDLIREHARALAARLDPNHDRRQAVDQLLDYYQHTAIRANALIAPQARPAPAAADAEFPAWVPVFDDRELALAWGRADRANLLACLDQATRADQHARVSALTAGLSGLLQRDGPWTDAVTRHGTAIAAARHLRDRLALANALHDLGTVQRLAGDFAAAATASQEALSLYRNLGCQLGEANALHACGAVQQMTGDYAAAARTLRRSLDIYRDLANPLGQANALHALGVVLQLTGDYSAGAQAEEQALGIYRDLGDQLGQALALNFLGIARYLTGDYPAATHALERALDIYRRTGNRLGEANSRYSLGNVLRLTGDYPAAAEAHQHVLDMYRQMGHRLGEANSLCSLGKLLRLTGDRRAAARTLEQALDLYRQIGSPGGEAEVLNERGALHRIGGDLALAEECHRQAMELARPIGSSWNEAHALAGLGRCALADGRTVEAEAGLRQALAIFERIGSGEAVGVSAEVEALSGPTPDCRV